MTELAVRLHEADRDGRLELLSLQAEPKSWRSFGGPLGRMTMKPDALVEIGVGDFVDAWFVEVDLATESTGALQRKAELYWRYYATGAIPTASGTAFPRVLWLVPDQRRHQQVTDALSRRPAQEWQLHRVVLYDDAVTVLAADGGES